MNKYSDPSFILVSLGRCGTSLFKNIIDSHSKLYLTDECHWLGAQQQAGRVFHKFSEVDDLSVTDIPMSSKWWEGVRAMNRSLFSDKNKTRWGIQFIGHYNVHNLNFIYKIYPDIPTIILLRDPRDLLHSYYRTGIGMPTFAEDLCKIQKIVKKNTSNFHSVKYENLCEDPEKSIQEICNFIEVNYEKIMLKALSVQVSHAKNTAIDSQLTITNKCSNKWRSSMTTNQLFAVEHSYKNIDELGYPVVKGRGVLLSSKRLTDECLSKNTTLSIYEKDISDTECSYNIEFTVSSILQIVSSSDSKLKIIFNDTIFLGYFNAVLNSYLFDLRSEWDNTTINYEPHTNGKCVRSCMEVLSAKPNNFFYIYSCSSLSTAFIKKYLLHKNKYCLGILDAAPKVESLNFENKVLSVYNANFHRTIKDALIFITNPTHYSSAKKLFEKNPWSQNEVLLVV